LSLFLKMEADRAFALGKINESKRTARGGMKRRPAKTSVAAAAGALVLVGLAGFLIELPSLYAKIRMDRSFPALSRYVFERTPAVVLVGSSMTYRVREEYFLNVPVRNIAISGGSPLTGLAIVGSYNSIPRLGMVETNIMARPTDVELIEQFGKNDAAPYQWFRPFRAIISLVYYWIKTESVAHDVARLPQLPPSDYDIAASLESAEREYSPTNLDEAIAKNPGRERAPTQSVHLPQPAQRHL